MCCTSCSTCRFLQTCFRGRPSDGLSVSVMVFHRSRFSMARTTFATMTYKTIINGVLIEADTVKEILALAAAAPGSGPSKQRSEEDELLPAASAAKTKKIVVRNDRHPKAAEVSLTYHILNAIRKQGLKGAESSALQPIVGGNIQALGSKLRPVKRVLQHLGYPSLEDVYRANRRDKKSIWLPGPKIEEAIERVRQIEGTR